jgi:hypothetical protein
MTSIFSYSKYGHGMFPLVLSILPFSFLFLRRSLTSLEIAIRLLFRPRHPALFPAIPACLRPALIPISCVKNASRWCATEVLSPHDAEGVFPNTCSRKADQWEMPWITVPMKHVLFSFIIPLQSLGAAALVRMDGEIGLCFVVFRRML